MQETSLDLQARISRLLQRAVTASGKPASEIARLSGMKRDSLRRSLSGERPFTIGEALAILDAANHAGEETLLLLLLAGEDFALAQGGTGPARFLGELFRRAPVEIIEQLGDNIEELRPVSVRARGVISGVGDGVFRGGACPTPECGVAGGHRVHRYGGVCTLQP